MEGGWLGLLEEIRREYLEILFILPDLCALCGLSSG